MGWSNLHVLATAENAPDNSVLHVWTMDEYSENIERHEYDATIVGIHSAWCKEIVLTHGPGKVTSHSTNLAAQTPSVIENSVMEYALSYFKQVKQDRSRLEESRECLRQDRDELMVVAVCGVDGGAASSQLQVCIVRGKKTALAPEPPSIHSGLVRRQSSFSSLSRPGSLIIR